MKVANVKKGGEASIVMVRISPKDCWNLRSDWRSVCKNDNACVAFPLASKLSALDKDDDTEVGNMTCYKGGETVFNNHQMCNVTS